MKRIVLIGITAVLMAFNATAQVNGFWKVDEQPADELLGTEAYVSTSFISNEVTFTIFSNDTISFLIGSPNEDVFVTNTPTTNKVKVIIGLYDSNMQLVQKLEHLMFSRMDDYWDSLLGRVNNPSMNKRWVADHSDLYKWITQEKGYIRVVAKRHKRNLDATIPTIKQSQQQ